MSTIPFGKCCVLGLVCLLSGEQQGQAEDLSSKVQAVSAHQAERHLKNIRQLTVGRQNAEAYFSFSGTKLIFQSTNDWVKDASAAPLKPADAGVLVTVLSCEAHFLLIILKSSGMVKQSQGIP